MSNETDLTDPVARVHHAFDELATRLDEEHRARLAAWDAAPAPVATQPRAAPEAVTEPDMQVIGSLVNLETGDLLFRNVGPLYSLPSSPHHPPVVRDSVEVLETAGPWLMSLDEEAIGLGPVLNPDERAERFVILKADAEGRSAEYIARLQSQAKQLREEASRLSRFMLKPGDELSSSQAREMTDYFLGLSEVERDSFLRQAERRGDWRSLRAVASSPRLMYAAPSVDPDDLLATAARLKHPRAGIAVVAYRNLADRLDRDARVIASRVNSAVKLASSYVDQSKVASVTRGMMSQRRLYAV